MTGEKWEATKLVTMIRELQPWIVLDNRLEVGGESYGSISSDEPHFYSGDFASPEQMIPPQGLTDIHGKSIPWESCITLNDNWGYCATDHHYKTPKMVIRNLVECVSKNGNMLLNVGPNAKGQIPDESLAILKEVGVWMKKNHDSIYGCGISELPKPEWGRYTQKGNKLYAHIYEECINAVCVDLPPERVAAIRLVADGSEIQPFTGWTVKSFPGRTFFALGHNNFPLPDDKDTVVELTLK